MRFFTLSIVSQVLLVALVSVPSQAANTLQVVTYQSSVTTDTNGPLDLTMELNYNQANDNMPVMVVMHQFSGSTGNFAAYRANAQRLRDQGFFVLTVAMRGRDGSDGVRDTGGLEIYDIYDAVEHVKTAYAGLVDSSNISITGYSGGGGNVMSAVTKFPDYFRAASSFFGMSDYGYDPDSGWYNNGASSGHRNIMNNDIGNPNTGEAAVLDRYMARASNLASMNNPYTEIHLFVNGNETTSPPVNHISFEENAVAQASFEGEFDNITVHIGQAGTYYDFNNNGINDPNEEQYWPHNAPTANQQAAAEQWYLSRLLSGEIAEPVLNDSDTLFVGGFVKTHSFEVWLGDGQNAAGYLDYQMSPGMFEFNLEILTSDLAATGWVAVNLADYLGTEFNVFHNGVHHSDFIASGSHTFNGLGHGDTLLFQAVPEPTRSMLLLGAALALACRRRRQYWANMLESRETVPGSGAALHPRAVRP